MNSPPPVPIHIENGLCHVYFAFDVGHGIDPERAVRQLTRTVSEQRSMFQLSRRAPATLQFKSPPLRLKVPTDSWVIAPTADAASNPTPPVPPVALQTQPGAEAAIYDFGAISIEFLIPLSSCCLESLLHLSASLYASAQLLSVARGLVEQVVRELGSAIHRPSLSDTVEDFMVFEVRQWQFGMSTAAAASSVGESRGSAEDLMAHREKLAQILRGEPQLLSESEVEEAVSARLSYGRDDLTLIDWNAALIFDPQADDTRTVLSYANVELLEMRYLDDRLDEILERAYARLAGRGRTWSRLRTSRAERRRLAALQMDSALLFEGINNAIKLLGDQYLARVYRLAARRFHLPDWDASVLRKLETLQRLYEKVSDEQATRRMEILEWIIIILIAISIAIPFLPIGR